MKILIIENTFNDFISSRLRLATYLSKNQLSIHALLPNNESKISIQKKYDYINFHFLENSNLRTKLKSQWNFIKTLKNLIQEENYDIIHSYRLQPNLLSGLCIITSKTNTKLICTVTGLGIAYSVQSTKFFFLRNLNTLLYKLIHINKKIHFVFQNEDDFNFFKFKSRSSIIKGSSINEEKFKYEPKMNQIKNNVNVKFLFAARLIAEKGIPELIDAFNLLTKENYNLELLIVGKEDSINPRSFSIKDGSLTDKITFVGERTDMHKIIHDVDVIILPTYYREGVPRILLEAMCMGRAIITTNVPGCRNLISTTMPNGILIEPKSSISIYNSVIQILKSDLIQMGLNGKKLYESEYSESIIFSQTLSLYTRVFGPNF